LVDFGGVGHGTNNQGVGWVRLAQTKQCSYNARNLGPEFSIIAIRVRGEIGARHAIDRSYRCIFTIARTASEFHIHSPITKHQKTGSAILAEITMRLMVHE